METARQPTVMIAEEDARVVRATRAAIGGRFKVVARVNRLGAVARTASEVHPDIVVMGLAWSGARLADALRELRGVSAIARVCIHARFAQAALVVESFRAGAKGYLIKPARSGELMRALDAILSGRRFLAPVLAGQPSVIDAMQGGRRYAPPFVTHAPEADGYDRALGWLQCDLRCTRIKAAILFELYQGRTHKEIAALLDRSALTVAGHLEGSYQRYLPAHARNAAAMSHVVGASLARMPTEW